MEHRTKYFIFTNDKNCEMKATTLTMTKELSAKIVEAAKNSELLKKIQEQAKMKHLSILK